MRLKDITPQWLIKTHFLGLYKTDENGEFYIPNPSNMSQRIENSVLEWAIEEAIAYVEDFLKVSVKYREQITEVHNYDKDLYTEFMQIVLRQYPIVKVNSLALKYGEQGATIWTVPSDLIQIHGAGSKFGLINVMPWTGTGGYDPTFANLYGGLFAQSHAPSIYHVNYNAGLDGLPEGLPPSIVRAISLKAAVHPFNILGDIVLGAGIASSSVSADGVSQSITTTSSAENSAFSARIIMHRKELMGEQGVPGLLQILQSKWRRQPIGLL